MEGKLVITNISEVIVSMFLDEKGNAYSIDIDTETEEFLLGDIYLGRVNNVVKSINAAFVEYAPGKMGYLAIDENISPIFTNIKNSDKICEGDEIVVQIHKEAMKSKEPVLTTNFNLTGKYCVLVYNNKGINFSKKITSQKRKNLIKENIEPLLEDYFGIIVRTNAADVDIEILTKEIKSLIIEMKNICESSNFRKNFSLIYKAPGTIISKIRDCYESETCEIITDIPEVYENARNFLNKKLPDSLGKLRFYNDELLSLKKLYRMEKILKDALSEKVWLKSGGYIIIQPTEALVVIDVNSGKSVSKKDSQSEFLKLNKEAAKEIAAQLRIRNLSGIIIIDFINLNSISSRNELLSFFEKEISKDPVQTTLVGMTRLNLVEVTRKKIRKPLHEILATKKIVI